MSGVLYLLGMASKQTTGYHSTVPKCIFCCQSIASKEYDCKMEAWQRS